MKQYKTNQNNNKNKQIPFRILLVILLHVEFLVWNKVIVQSKKWMQKINTIVSDTDTGRDPFNQNFRKFRSKTQSIGSVKTEKFEKTGPPFWGGPLFPVGPVEILVEWIAPTKFH